MTAAGGRDVRWCPRDDGKGKVRHKQVVVRVDPRTGPVLRCTTCRAVEHPRLHEVE